MSIYKSSSLAMIPTAYKDGKLYSVRPTDGSGDFTFSRGSNLAATRVASSGLIEKGRENLLLQSNQFDTTWTNTSSAETSGFEGYDGTNNAWKLEKTGNGGRLRQTISLSGVNTFSVYAKAGTAKWLRLLFETISDSYYFDLENGVLGSSTSQPVDGNIESVGNGWYRCSVTGSGTIGAVRIYPADDDLDVTGTSGSIYIQDAQLEQGLVATDYIETGASTAQAGILEDMPRLDYSGGASCPSLLLEPQRSNVITQSEYIGAWTPSGLTITDNDATSPEGVSNAAKLTLPSGSAQKRIALGSMPVTSVARSYSFFFKSDDITAVQLVHSGDLQGYARFDISTGVVGSTGTKTTSDIEDYGNGWYRCVANFDSTNAFGSTIYLYISDSATGGYGGSTSAQGDLFVYGAQYEEGSYPTSYIPTYGSSVTRSDDFMNISSLADEINGNSFTYFLEVNNEAVVRDASTGNISVGATGNRFFLYNSNATSNRLQLFIQDSGGIEQYVLSADNVKIAIRFEPNNVEVFENGVSVLSTTQNLDFSANSAYVLRGTTREIGIKQTAIFPTALTDSECIALTTL